MGWCIYTTHYLNRYGYEEMNEHVKVYYALMGKPWMAWEEQDNPL